jgi:hypothetical protein
VKEISLGWKEAPPQKAEVFMGSKPVRTRLVADKETVRIVPEEEISFASGIPLEIRLQ